MHEWEKQSKLLEKIESYQIADCLTYNNFVYEKHEWDNIPSIVPRYVIYLSKYMKGICAVCKEFQEREATDQLRKDIEHKLSVTNIDIQSARKIDLKEKGDIKQAIADHKQIADDFRDTYDRFIMESSGTTEFNLLNLFKK